MQSKLIIKMFRATALMIGFFGLAGGPAVAAEPLVGEVLPIVFDNAKRPPKKSLGFALERFRPGVNISPENGPFKLAHIPEFR